MSNFNPYKINEINTTKFYQLPQELFENPRYNNGLNSDAKLLYAILLNRMELSRINNWVNEQGEIYLIYTREELCKVLGVSINTTTKAFKQLSACGLIYEKRQGLTKPNLIFIGKIDYTGEQPSLNHKICDSINSKPVIKQSQKLGGSNTNIIKTNNKYMLMEKKLTSRNHSRTVNHMNTKALYEI